MTRLRTDQACLEAQMQQQIAQNLNAELAVPCPDCGVESGRACRDSLDRAVRTHLARSVAANRRDTEPCPAPTEGAFKRDLHAMIEAGLEQESLTRAAAREFAESHHSEWLREELERRSILDATISRDPFSGYLEVRHSGDRYARVSELEIRGRELRPSALSCSSCREFWTEESFSTRHHSVHGEAELAWVETVCQRCYVAAPKTKTPTAPDCAPAIAPEAVASTQPTAFPVEECGGCSRPLKSGAKKFGELFGPPLCGDCAAERVRAGKPAPLDKRIAETKSDDATECAWSTPTSDGEGWR